jgi:Arc/MetJ-type ribon-helix-helix transcriptional regulator
MPEKHTADVNLRLPRQLLDRIDEAVASGASLTRSEEIRRLIAASLEREGPR